MEKKSIVLHLTLFSLIAFWIFLVGQVGQSIFAGSINLIDEGQFLAWVMRMQNGQVIYKDFYVQYGPLMILPMYMLMKIFGASVFILKIWEFLGVFIGILIGFVTLKRLRIEKPIFLLSLVFLTITPGINLRYWIGVLFILVLVYAYKKISHLWCLIAGSLLVLTSLQSIDVGIFAFITTSLYIVVRLVGSKNLLLELRMFGSILIGFILSLLILSSIFSYFGWWQSYLSTTIEFTSSIAGVNLPNGQGLPVITFNRELLSPIYFLKTVFGKNALFYISFGVLVIFSSITLIRLTFKKAKETDTIAFLISIFGLLIYFSIIGRSGHYFIIVPFIIVIGAYLLTLVKGFWRILFLILFGIYFIRHFMILRYDIFTNFYSVKYQQTIDRVSPFQTTLMQGNEITLIQKYFSMNVGQEQQIYVLNNVPALYFILDRKNATKYDLPLLAGTLEKRLETVEVLKAKIPLVIEYVNAWSVDGISDRLRQPEVFQFVDKNYIINKRVGPFTLYIFKQSRN